MPGRAGLRSRPHRYRSKGLEAFVPLQDHLHDVEISTFRLSADAPLAGKSLSQVELRKKHGVSVLAIRRNSQVFHNPDPDMVMLANDLLITMGSPENMAKATSLFTKREDE